MWDVLIPIVFIFMFFGGMGAIVHLIDGRRKFRLEMKEKEARIAEAKAKELEVEQQRAELEYRQAMLELERFDRRTGGGPPLPPARAPEPSAEPSDSSESPTPPD